MDVTMKGMELELSVFLSMNSEGQLIKQMEKIIKFKTGNVNIENKGYIKKKLSEAMLNSVLICLKSTIKGKILEAI